MIASERPFLREVHDQLTEALAFLAEAVGDGDADIGEVQLAGVLAVQTELVEVPPTRSKPGMPRSTTNSDRPRWRSFDVRATTITRSAFWPLEMNVFEPFKT